MEEYQLFYEKEENVFIDNGGDVVFDIFSIISPNDLLLFKEKKEYMFLINKDGVPVELFYPDDYH